jgi:hypothetical protein
MVSKSEEWVRVREERRMEPPACSSPDKASEPHQQSGKPGSTLALVGRRPMSLEVRHRKEVACSGS